MTTAKTVEKKGKSDKKVEKLEGMVLANRFGAKTVWSGILTTIVSTILFFVASIPIGVWLSSCLDMSDSKKIVVLAGGNAAMFTMLAAVIVYYVAIVVGMVRVIMGIYRMAHPEKYIDRVLGKE
ncbi:MAG: hypothetical protein ACK5MU_04690 [Candidatus Saccharimonadales bacterium]